jgi:hypothetical protein
LRVFLFPCGSEISLEVQRSLKNIRDLDLIGGSSIDDHGKFSFDEYIGGIPYITSDEFIPFVKKIVREKSIDFIYPCMDIVIAKMKENEEEIGCKVISSPSETASICLSKKKTYDFLKDIVRTPEILDNKGVKKFPVFSKPEIGSSSRFTFKIEDSEDLKFYSKKFPENLILEYLPGDEYTVDCFTNKKRELVFIGPRIRSRISNGISVNTKIINDPLIEDMAKKINSKMEFNGSWFFQIKKDLEGEYCLLEVASRFGGSSSIQRYRGINFSLLNIYNEMGIDVQIFMNGLEVEMDRSLSIRLNSNLEFDSVYIDLDDTIIIKNKINIDAISAIYSFLNEGKKIILISKHKGKILETLSKYKIEKNIFSEIIQILPEEEKYLYMEKNSIFIDDSFSERKKVHEKLGIPTFGLDTINMFV